RLTADGQVTVRVEEKFVLNEAVLTLQDRRGQARQWVLQTPLQTAVEVKAGEEQGPVAVTSDKNQSRHTLQVKEPTAQPLEVVLRPMRPRSAGRIPVGPFRVLAGGEAGNPVRQEGTLLIKAGSDVRLGYLWPGEPRVLVTRREVSDEQRREAVVASFRYWD